MYRTDVRAYTASVTDQPTDHLTLEQAAIALGISREAVRLRIRRGTLAGERIDGRWFVSLLGQSPTDRATDRATDRPGRARQPTDRDALLTELRDRVAFLERLTEHQAGVIAQQSASLADLVQRPALPEPRTAPPAETPTEPPREAPQSPVRRPWWRRLLGG